MKNEISAPFILVAGLVMSWMVPVFSFAQGTNTTGAKPFIDYFLPIPIIGSLSKDVWGAPTVGPRDPQNGLEDTTMKKWDYWDGKIFKGPDGKYHMLASRWDQAVGHNGWFNSKGVHAVSNTLLGPYIDQGLCWPDNEEGKGHNVTGLVMPDGTYTAVVSETRNGDVFNASSLDGPWKQLGSITVNQDKWRAIFSPRSQPDGKTKVTPWRASNVSLIVRPDGDFEIVQRSGQIMISKTGVLGTYTIEGPSIYPKMPSLPQSNLGCFEDPVIWFSGGWYHIVVNNWKDRKAYHLISADGITGWKFQGLAFDPTVNFIRYTDGTINHWEKLERPGVYLENGHVAAVTLAVIDVPKEDEKGNDNHGSKVIVIPFDGAAMDRDLQPPAGADTPPAPVTP
jgi:hypothetical protein